MSCQKTENSWTAASPSVLIISLSSLLSQDIGHALNVNTYSVLELEKVIGDKRGFLTSAALSV